MWMKDIKISVVFWQEIHTKWQMLRKLAGTMMHEMNKITVQKLFKM